MDAKKFANEKTGTLVPIKTPVGADFAFVPNALPPNWELPLNLYPLLVEARAAVAKLDGIGQTLPDQELLLAPLKRREAISSSRIEGTYATAQELMLFELTDQNSNSTNEQHNSWREVNNYSRALSYGIEKLKEMPFCARIIKDLHRILMNGVRGQQANMGEWRNHQVAIGSDRRFVPPPVPEMSHSIDDFEKYINEPSPLDPLVNAYIAHYQFETIHPFSDGNGRIGRVLLSLMIWQWCDLSAPYVYMSPYFEKYRTEYVDKMFAISSTGAWANWVEFCLKGTIAQSKDAILKCEKLAKLRKEMLEERHVKRSKRTERIINDLFKNPIIRVTRLVEDHEVTYPTAQKDIDRLVEDGILRLLTNVHPKAYFSPEIFAIAYVEPGQTEI